MAMTSSQPVVPNIIDYGIREGQQVLLRLVSVMHQRRIFKDIVGGVGSKHSHQVPVSTVSNEVIRVNKGYKLTLCKLYTGVPCC